MNNISLNQQFSLKLSKRELVRFKKLPKISNEQQKVIDSFAKMMLQVNEVQK